MQSANDRPSVWDIRACLLSSVDFAQDFAEDHPEFADAVEHFSHEVRRIKKQLMASLRDDSIPASLHDIVNGVTGARGNASVMAERYPEKSGVLNLFEEDLTQALKNLVRTIRPDWGMVHSEPGDSNE
jgi:hypothetical protein